MKHIAIDVDGVLIDHTEIKLRIAKQLGYQIESWQTNANCMQQYMHESAYRRMQKMIYEVQTLESPPVLGAIQVMKELKENPENILYILSARRMGPGRKQASEWLERYGIHHIIPKERWIFVEKTIKKKDPAKQLQITHAIDDSIDALTVMPVSTKKILLDEMDIYKKVTIPHDVLIAKNWTQVALILNRR